MDRKGLTRGIPEMNNNTLNKSEPDENDDDDFILNDLLHHIVKHGTILDEKGRKVLNPELIFMGNKQLIIKHSLFKNDKTLKEKLLQLPREGIDDVLRIVIEDVITGWLAGNVYIDLRDWEFILINDDCEYNFNPLATPESTGNKSNDNNSKVANNKSQHCDKDNLFDNILTQVTEIVTENDIEGIIRISKQEIIKLGFKSKEEFEDEILHKIFKQVEKTTGIDIKKITLLMTNKIAYLE